MSFLQLILNGVALGAAYALVALGFVFIVNATGAVNFAQGDLVMAGGYTAIALSSFLAVPFLVLLPLVALITFFIGVALGAGRLFPADAKATGHRVHQHAALRNDLAERFRGRLRAGGQVRSAVDRKWNGQIRAVWRSAGRLSAPS